MVNIKIVRESRAKSESVIIVLLLPRFILEDLPVHHFIDFYVVFIKNVTETLENKSSSASFYSAYESEL